jgi:release factor glutamine methyltransferase
MISDNTSSYFGASKELPTVRECLLFSLTALDDAGIDTPRLDSQLLLASAMNCRREDLAAHPERLLTVGEAHRFFEAFGQRKARRPLAYILGSQWFYGAEFDVCESVLIPRPETELLVEFALLNAPKNGAVADIATGSGCIAISVAASRPDLNLCAVDISQPALDVAVKNAEKHKIMGRVRFFCGDLLAPLQNERFDIIVSNPPYISSRDVAGLMPEVRDFEPAIALYEGAGDDGLAVYRRLAPGSVRHLNSGGRLAVEVGFGQAKAVEEIAKEAGFIKTELLLDGAGIERVVVAFI